jgi:hypothetical protein
MNQEIPLSGGDNITNVVDAQWGVAAITPISNVSVTIPAPVFSVNIDILPPQGVASSVAIVIPEPVFSVSMVITGPPIIAGSDAKIRIVLKSNRVEIIAKSNRVKV